MLFNERKLQTLEFFARREWVRPTTYAVAVGMYPTKVAYPYLKKQHRYSYLRRGRDFSGRIVYRLARRGAMWLLKNRRPLP